MKRISFSHTPPRSKNKLRTTAFWTAAFLLLFANLFAFALAEDLPGEPDGETAVADESGNPNDEGSQGDENGDPAEPVEDEAWSRPSCPSTAERTSP